jgi:hypothetical protein
MIFIFLIIVNPSCIITACEQFESLQFHQLAVSIVMEGCPFLPPVSGIFESKMSNRLRDRITPQYAIQ